MATLAVTEVSRSGVDIVGAAASSGGDEWPNTGREFVLVKNGGGSPITLTLDIKVLVDDDLAVTDPTVSISAGATEMVGPFPPGIYNDAATGRAKVTYSGVSSVTIKVVSLAAA